MEELYSFIAFLDNISYIGWFAIIVASFVFLYVLID